MTKADRTAPQIPAVLGGQGTKINPIRSVESLSLFGFSGDYVCGTSQSSASHAHSRLIAFTAANISDRLKVGALFNSHTLRITILTSKRRTLRACSHDCAGSQHETVSLLNHALSTTRAGPGRLRRPDYRLRHQATRSFPPCRARNVVRSTTVTQLLLS